MNIPINRLHRSLFRVAAVAAAFTLIVISAIAADTAPPLSATDLAARLSSLRQDGTSYVRLRMEVKQPPDTTKIALQLQIKSRRTERSTELVYQVLWPKERKGEAVLLRKSGGPASGALFVPPNTVRSLDASQMQEPFFGSDLSYEDVIENFFAWKDQTIVGTEVIDRVSCQILESKPGKGDRSTYSKVRTWVDTRRLVPLRIEKFLSSGQFARRIDTTRVVTADNHQIPANLTVQSSRRDSLTELDGSRIKQDVTFTDREFTPEGIKEMAAPRAGAE